MNHTFTAYALAPLAFSISLLASLPVHAASQVHLVLKKDPLIPKATWAQDSKDYFGNNLPPAPGGGGGGGTPPADSVPSFSLLTLDGGDLLAQVGSLDVINKGLGSQVTLQAGATDPEGSPLAYSWSIAQETPAYDVTDASNTGLAAAQLASSSGDTVSLTLPQGPISDLVLNVTATEQDATPKQISRQIRLTTGAQLSAILMDVPSAKQVAANTGSKVQSLTEGDNATLQPWVYNHGKRVSASLASWNWAIDPAMAVSVTPSAGHVQATSLKPGDFNLGAQSSLYGLAINRTFVVGVASNDLVAPTVSMVVSNAAPTGPSVTFTATATDDRSVDSVELLNSPALTTVNSMLAGGGNTYTRTLDVRNLREGQAFNYVARAKDVAGKQTDSAQVQIRRAVDLPVVTSNISTPTADQLLVKASATDSSSLVRNTVFIDNINVRQAETSVFADYTYTLPNDYVDKTTNVRVEFFDAWLNKGSSSSNVNLSRFKKVSLGTANNDDAVYSQLIPDSSGGVFFVSNFTTALSGGGDSSSAGILVNRYDANLNLISSKVHNYGASNVRDCGFFLGGNLYFYAGKTLLAISGADSSVIRAKTYASAIDGPFGYCGNSYNGNYLFHSDLNGDLYKLAIGDFSSAKVNIGLLKVQFGNEMKPIILGGKVFFITTDKKIASINIADSLLATHSTFRSGDEISGLFKHPDSSGFYVFFKSSDSFYPRGGAPVGDVRPYMSYFDSSGVLVWTKLLLSDTGNLASNQSYVGFFASDRKFYYFGGNSGAPLLLVFDLSGNSLGSEQVHYSMSNGIFSSRASGCFADYASSRLYFVRATAPQLPNYNAIHGYRHCATSSAGKMFVSGDFSSGMGMGMTEYGAQDIFVGVVK